MKTIIYLTILLFFCTTAGAQDLGADLTRVYYAYHNKDILSVTVTVNTYSKNNPKPVVQTADLKKKGNLFLYRMENSEMLITENNLILTSHSNKNIMKRKIDEAERNAMRNRTIVPELGDSTSKVKYDSLQFRMLNEKEKLYTIYDSKSLVYKTDMQFDTETDALTKIVYYYKPEAKSSTDRVEILYTEEADPNLKEELFSEELYIVPAGDKLKAAPKFQNYELNIVNP